MSRKDLKRCLFTVLLGATDYRMAKNEIQERIAKMLNLDPEDWHWQDELRWVRSNCVSEGAIYKSGHSGRGFWQLTPLGVQLAQN